MYSRSCNTKTHRTSPLLLWSPTGLTALHIPSRSCLPLPTSRHSRSPSLHIPYALAPHCSFLALSNGFCNPVLGIHWNNVALSLAL
ncbi:hypothetical protein E2C01_077297 [Portunus trituberculatus]|uniref:Uncharacterized protein n=1 Tax=Portunus trituberculatus TaxID=210409 RepID=A0A5B7IFI4_PORTR|nr:hypothetical protein [Portunus trituberculatus]